MNRASSFLIKKGTKMNKFTYFIATSNSFWRLHQPKGNLCDRQVYRWRTWWPPALTSFLSAALGKCVSCRSVPLRLHVYVWMCVCVFGHTPPLTWGQVRLGLVPDSGKSGQLQNLTQMPWHDTHTHTHTQLNTQTVLISSSLTSLSLL